MRCCAEARKAKGKLEAAAKKGTGSTYSSYFFGKSKKKRKKDKEDATLAEEETKEEAAAAADSPAEGSNVDQQQLRQLLDELTDKPLQAQALLADASLLRLGEVDVPSHLMTQLQGQAKHLQAAANALKDQALGELQGLASKVMDSAVDAQASTAPR